MPTQISETGLIVTSSTTGSIVNLVPRSCQVLGFWTTASQTALTIYDSATTAGTSSQIVIGASAVGWNFLPIELVNGLSVNQGAQAWFVIQ